MKENKSDKIREIHNKILNLQEDLISLLDENLKNKNLSEDKKESIKEFMSQLSESYYKLGGGND